MLKPSSDSSQGAASGSLTLQLIDEVRGVKKPTALCVAQLPASASSASSSTAANSDSVLIVADKMGEATAYPLPSVSCKKRWLVGHTATIITAVETATLPDAAFSSSSSSSNASTTQHQFLITGDRDEAIRVSALPDCWRLQSTCRGHTRFVSALRTLPCGVGPGDECDRPFAGSLSDRASQQGGTSSSLLLPGPMASPDDDNNNNNNNNNNNARSIGSSDVPMGGSGAAACAIKMDYLPQELLVSGGGDGTLRLWHLPSGTLLHTAYMQMEVPSPRDMSGSNSSADNAAVASSAGGAAAPSFSSSSSALLSSPPVNHGPLPKDSVNVVLGPFGCFGSAGPHCDCAMNFSAGGGDGDNEGGGGSEQQANAGGEAAEEDGNNEEEEGTEEAAGAPSDAASSTSPAAAGTSGSGSGGKLVIPRAFIDRDSYAKAATAALHSAPPTYPAQIAVTSGSSAPGLVATFLEGEHGVRLFRVCMEAQPPRLAPAPGHATTTTVAAVSSDGRLPQAKLSQVGIIRLPFAPLAIHFVKPTAAAEAAAPPLLLVGGVDNSDSSRRYVIRAFSLSVTPCGNSNGISSSGSANGSPRVVEACVAGKEVDMTSAAIDEETVTAYGAALASIAALNQKLAAAASASSSSGNSNGAERAWAALAPPPVGTRLYTHFVGERLSDYDKFVAAAEEAVRIAAKQVRGPREPSKPRNKPGKGGKGGKAAAAATKDGIEADDDDDAEGAASAVKKARIDPTA